MAVHVICPSLRCRKILELNDDARGRTVTCRYCQMEFRVPRPTHTKPAAPMISGRAVRGSNS